jgi:acyl-CoA reductase-like NAD-dependent aldehyde dehydrogenase
MFDLILASARSGDVSMAPAFLAGEWLQTGPTLDRVGPHRREVVSRARVAETGDAVVAGAYARVARGRVAGLAPAARADILDRAAAIAQARADDFARLIALELGKPVKDGRAEMERVADTLAICAAEARQIGGDMLPVAGWARGINNTAMTYRAPAGAR